MHKVATRKGAHCARVPLVAAAAMLAICLLALAATTKTASATFPAQNGRIAYQSNRVTQDNPEGDYEIHKMNPDGEQITFHSDRDGSFDVFKMDSDGTGQIDLTQGASSRDVTPTFSPSGKEIAFQSDRGTNTEIYKMSADGSNPTRLTDKLGVDGESDWQPVTPKSHSSTVDQPDTGGPSLLLIASALLISGGVMFYAGLKRRM